MAHYSSFRRKLPSKNEDKLYQGLSECCAQCIANLLHMRQHAIQACYLTERPGARAADLMRLPFEERVACVLNARPHFVDMERLINHPLDNQCFSIGNVQTSVTGDVVRDLQLRDLNGPALLFIYLPEEVHADSWRSVSEILKDDAIFDATLARVRHENSPACAEEICGRLRAYRHSVLTMDSAPCVVRLNLPGVTVRSHFSKWLSGTRNTAQQSYNAHPSVLRDRIVANGILQIIDLVLLTGPYQGLEYTQEEIAEYVGLSDAGRIAEIHDQLDFAVDFYLPTRLLGEADYINPVDGTAIPG